MSEAGAGLVFFTVFWILYIMIHQLYLFSILFQSCARVR